MLIQTFSGQLTRALVVNKQDQYLQSIDTLAVEPTADGVFKVAQDNNVLAQNRLFVLPFVEGEPAVEFFMRVYAWRHIGSDPAQIVWVPDLLVETFCVAGIRGGIDSRALRSKEYLADTVILTNGSVGSGFVMSAGGGLGAYVVLDLLGCRRFQFDFVVGEEYPGFPNALWTFA